MAESNHNLSRILGNVVDIQQTIVINFDNLTKTVENLRIDHSSSLSMLREDIRRIDDRCQSNISELKKAHHQEIERLLKIVETLLNKETVSQVQQIPQIPPAMLAHQQQQQQNTALQHALLMQNQQRYQEEMHRIATAQAQAQMQALIINNAAKTNLPATIPQAGTLGIAKPAAPVTSITNIPQVVPKVEEKPVAVPKPVVVPPATPAVGAVTTPAAPAVSAVTTPAAPAVSTVTTPATVPTTKATTGFSFGNNTGTGLFGTKPETSTSSTPGLNPGISLFGKKPDTDSAKSTTTTSVATPKNSEKDDEDTVEEYEPNADFKPVIPLPDLIEVKTGEEEETVLFNHRAKLYIWVATKEWKERGVGDLKVLYNKDSKKYRVVMRREQVLKVCANFPIVGSMTIQKMASNDKAFVWFCEDFSEEAPEVVKLSARFGTIEIANEFKSLFEKAVSQYVKSDKTQVKSTSNTIDKEIKPAEVKEEAKQPVKVEKEGKPVEIPSDKENIGFGDKFKPEEGSWECKECYVRNKAESEACSCCGAGKDGKPADKAASIFSKPSIIQPATGTPKFSFGMSAAAAAKEPVGQKSTNSPLFGSALNNGTNNASSAFGSSNTPKTSIFGGGSQSTTPNNKTPQFTFGKTATTAAVTTTNTPKFNFVKASEATTGVSSPGNSSGGAPIFGANAFSFNKPAETKSPMFSFNEKSNKSEKNENPEKPQETKSIFGNFPQGDTFASLGAMAKTKNIFEGETAKKAQEEFNSQRKSVPLFEKAKANDDEKEDDENDENGEYEPQVDFKPVIPLPDLIEVKTGEEDEEVLFKARCKLYKYVKETKENKERGVGDIKILHNKEDGKYRVVMRREQVHKLCANFRISKNLELKAKSGLPNVYNIVCLDFSENVTEGTTEVFSIKFKEENTASKFRDKFNEVRENC